MTDTQFELKIYETERRKKKTTITTTTKMSQKFANEPNKRGGQKNYVN